MKETVTTETVRATNFGGLLGAFESKLVMEKRWSAAHDLRTRGAKPNDKYDHLHLDKVQTDLLKPFFDSKSGEPIMYPGDPLAKAGNVINCRCSLAFIPKRDANGKLMFKKPQQSAIAQQRQGGNSLVDFLGGVVSGLLIGLNED